MNEWREHFEKRIGRFGRVRRSLMNATLFYGVGVLVLGVGIAALLLLSGWTENAVVNAVLTLAALIALIVLLARFLLRWERRRSTLSEAFRMEELADDLNSRIVSAVDFLERSESTPLIDVVVNRAREDLERPFERLLDRSARNRLRIRFVLLLVCFLALGVTDRFGFLRLVGTVKLCALNLRESLFPTQFEIFPGAGDHVYLIGNKIDAGLRFTRFRYPEVTMLRETEGVEGVEEIVLPVDETGLASLALQPSLEQEYRIRLAFGKRVSEEMHVVFTATPLIENMQVELVYPLYTRLLPKESEGIQDRVTALAGTRVNLGFVFTKALEAAELTFDDNSRLPLDVVGRFASVSFVHSEDRQATLQVRDVHGFSMDAPHRMTFGVTADKPPRLIVPNHLRLDMPQTVGEFGSFTLGARVEDDFGAAKCVVKWHKAKAEKPGEITMKGEPIERVFIPPRPTAMAAFENIFREQARSAEPGDLFTFQVTAFDNRQPTPQSTVSSMFSIFIRGQGLEDRTSADSSVDIMAKFGGVGGNRVQRKFQPSDPSRIIKMPQGLKTAERYRSDFTADRKTDTRGEVRGPHDKTASAYMGGASGAE